MTNGHRVVYSAVFGGYESLQPQPLAKTQGYTFVLYTDQPVLESVDWQVRRVKPRFPTDPVRSARYVKIRGERDILEFDESLWIDNRVVLRGSLDSLFDLRGDSALALPMHSYRGALIEEFEAVIDSGFDDPSQVRRMLRIAQHFGVLGQQTLWTGMILRSRNSQVSAAMERWAEFVLLTSRRDQLSVHSALAAVGLEPKMLSLDNHESLHHVWMSQTMMNRSQAIQFWRPDRRRVSLRAADSLRRTEIGRTVARRLVKVGMSLPRL